MNHSSVGTLVERTTLIMVLANMPDGKAQSALNRFIEAHQCDSTCVTQNFHPRTKGCEMSKHAQLSERTGVAVYLFDTHSLGQLGLNENTNGLLHQGLSKGEACRYTG